MIIKKMIIEKMIIEKMIIEKMIIKINIPYFFIFYKYFKLIIILLYI